MSASSVWRWENGNTSSNALMILRINALEELVSLAKEVFEKEGVYAWFHRGALALGRETPIDFIIQRGDGAERVKALLTQIEYGVLS